MATNASIITKSLQALTQVDGIALTIMPDAGTVASTPIPGLALTDGMIVIPSLGTSTASTPNANSEGIYDVAVSGANYTLTLNTSLSTTATFNAKLPTLFKVSQGTNRGIYLWSFDIAGAASFVNYTPNAYYDLQDETVDSATIASLASAANTTATITFTNTYTRIISISVVAYKDGAAYNIGVFDNTAAADLLTERTFNIVNNGSLAATNFVIRAYVIGI